MAKSKKTREDVFERNSRAWEVIKQDRELREIVDFLGLDVGPTEEEFKELTRIPMDPKERRAIEKISRESLGRVRRDVVDETVKNTMAVSDFLDEVFSEFPDSVRDLIAKALETQTSVGSQGLAERSLRWLLAHREEKDIKGLLGKLKHTKKRR